jgi:hypothetical protein
MQLTAFRAFLARLTLLDLHAFDHPVEPVIAARQSGKAETRMNGRSVPTEKVPRKP